MEDIRKKKLRINTFVALTNQVITILHGFVLPRLYLTSFGSNVYGLSTSITQFLSFISLMELGVGAVVQSSLYKPLAEKNNEEISKIIVSADRFFKRIAGAFLVYTCVIAVIYPTFIRDDFPWWYEFSLIIIISISGLAEYFFGMTYRLLLIADQKAYVTLGLNAISLVLHLGACAIAMRAGASIQFVMLVSAVVLLLRPIGQNIYVQKKYLINKKIVFTDEPIKQKWNGIAQHLAYYVTNNTDVIVLTVLSTLTNVAIYSIYNMVTNGIKQLVISLNSGSQALFGNMIANKEYEEIERSFYKFEWMIHTLVVFLFICIGVLVVPFVLVYTKGINDAVYNQPLFAVILTMSQAMYCLRLPYNIIVMAGGHYKQTQASAIIEMLLNLIITIVLVFRFGLVGVAVGTLIALSYRTVYFAFYISRNIIEYNFMSFIKHMIVDALTVIVVVILTYHIHLGNLSYYQWLIMAVKVATITSLSIVIINYIFYKEYLKNVFRKVARR